MITGIKELLDTPKGTLPKDKEFGNSITHTPPFKDYNQERIDLYFYIPKNVFTSITEDSKYIGELKNLSLKTDIGLKNKNNYHRCTITVDVPEDQFTSSAKELYEILTNCGINKATAEVAVKTAMGRDNE